VDGYARAIAKEQLQAAQEAHVDWLHESVFEAGRSVSWPE